MDRSIVAWTAFVARTRVFQACLVVLVAAFGWCAPAHADDIAYSYDELGRVVQASNVTTGEAVLYTYDAAGNITSQRMFPLGTLAIGHFAPARGPQGTQVTINGTGFSATPASDTVRFNGTVAGVVSASETRLVVTVPPGATTGNDQRGGVRGDRDQRCNLRGQRHHG